MQTIDQMDLGLGFKLVSDYQSYPKSLVLYKVGMYGAYVWMQEDLGPCMQNDEHSDPDAYSHRRIQILEMENFLHSGLVI